MPHPYRKFFWGWMGFLGAAILWTAGCEAPAPPDTTQAPTPTQATSTPIPAGKDTAYFVRKIADLRHWADFHPGERTILRSSHNPNDGPQDADFFLGEPRIIDGKPWHVLADETGPGCMTRIWIGDKATGNLRFYFDGEKHPRWETGIQDFFQGSFQEAASMLVLSPTDTGCGQVWYVPIPFQKHCTLLTDSQMPDFKYQVEIRQFAPEENVQTFIPQIEEPLKKALVETNEFLNQAGVQRFADSLKQEVKIVLPPQQNQMLLSLPGPGAIDYFEIQTATATVKTVDNLELSFYWDNLDDPSVHCNLREFFCNVDLQKSWNSLPLGFIQDYNLFYSQFYMPFEKKAQIIIRNNNAEAVPLVFRYHLDLDSTHMPKNPLYLFVHSDQRKLFDGMDYALADFEGKGQFVGLSFKALSDPMNQKDFYLEGDEYEFIDGETNASLAGTGMDNYFNADERMGAIDYFWFPTHGCIDRIDTIDPQTKLMQTGRHCFRFRLLDMISFQTSFLMVQEIGCPVQFSATGMTPKLQTKCHWTGYWYGRPASSTGKRNEQAFYYSLTSQETDAPNLESPIMLGRNLHLKVPAGTWWIHYAPVGSPTDVHHLKQEVH